MPTKKKKSTKTASKKTVATKTHRKATSRTSCKNKSTSPREKWHVYIVTALGIITAILLCMNVAMINVG